MGAAGRHFAHFRSDGGGHGAHRRDEGFEAGEDSGRVAGDHHHGHRFAQRATDTEHDGIENAAARRGDDHAPDDLPLGGAGGVGCFTERFGHRVKGIFGQRYDGGDRDQRQQDSAGQGGQAGGQVEADAHGGREHEDANEPQHNGRDAGQDLDQRFEDLVDALRGDLANVNRGADAKGQGDHHREQGHDQRAADERQDAIQPFDRVPAGGE